MSDDTISRADAVQRDAADPEASVWVAASAGTGKTKVLTDRVLRLMLGGDEPPTPPARILCLTFTKAAAAEMANRLARRLGEWAVLTEAKLTEELEALTGVPPTPAQQQRARQLLAAVLESPGGMRIQTVHAFCQALLARFPLEAGVSPHFEVADERSAGELLASVQEALIGAIDSEGGDALARALAVITAHVHEINLPGLLAELAKERGRLDRLRRRHGGLAGLVAHLRDRLGVGAGETPEDGLAMACGEGAFDRDALGAAAAALGEGSDKDRKRSDTIAQWLALADAEARLAGLADYERGFLTKDGRPYAKLASQKVASALSALEAEAERLEAIHERRRRATVAQTTEAILTFATALLDAYDDHKRARNWLDYDDLVLKARALLSPGAGRAAWVLYKLDGGLDHILVDEAQDTNPDQWAVVEALADEFFAGEGAREARRTVFGVGDAKQSIYGFQRADPHIFAGIRERFAKRVRAAERDWRQVPLDVSFRSTTAVLDAVDHVFADAQAQDGLLFGDNAIKHESARHHQAGRVELWPPVEAAPEDAPVPWKPPVERREAHSASGRLAADLAEHIAALTDGSHILDSHARPIEAGDILVLVRRRNAFMDELVRRLKECAVPVAGIDRLVLSHHIAVMDLISLARFLLLPDDDLSLAETLKSPLFGLDDDDLFALAYDRRQRSLWQVLKARRALKPAWDLAVHRLGELLARADAVAPFELFGELLSRPGGRHDILARIGAEAIDPLDELLAQALAYERAHVASLQGFLHWLESGQVEVKRDLDIGAGGALRVMTVHGAKGLEAPIVFLPDTMQVPNHTPALAWDPGGEGVLWAPYANLRDSLSQAWVEEAKHREAQEHRRLLYVAMTRAADRLIVCGWRGKRSEPADCWYHLVRNGLQELAEPVAGEGLRYQVARAEGTEPDRKATPRSEPETPALEEWARHAPPPEPTPPRPLVPSAALTEEPPARSPLVPEAAALAERGRLIHRLLQSLPELPPGARAGACRRFLARPALALDAAARAEIAAAALGVMAEPAFAAVFAPGSRAEVAIAGTLPGPGLVLSGQIDRLAVTEAEVLAVDYKTGRTPPEEAAATPAAYLRQMAAYRAGLRAIYPCHRVRCALLWTEGPRLMPLADALLDRHAPA